MNEVRSFVFEDHGIRGALVRLNETWRHIVAQHTYPPRVEQLLGEGVAATVLLANGLKDKPRVSIQLQGNGPLKLLLIQCSEDLSVRGMAHWRPHAEHDALLGEGRLAVNLDTGSRQGVFQGIVPLAGPHLETCLEAYFHQSEQLATRLVLTSTETQAAGLLLQMLPSIDSDAETEHFERAAALLKDTPLPALREQPAEELLPQILPRERIRLFKPQPVLHDCRCTPTHLAGIARMLGADELHAILRDEGRVELNCEFCNRAFSYDDSEVAAILRGEAPGPALH
jgi:molecular chaperone Hsp33